ncbi:MULTISPECIES: TetR/AcrR family transcriptional regulator [unclassified Enterococcus]|uniref:TetR/AcrR family transcriptional regulator n=1 Tax=unclassified Enterococcus TaxID=2608891 RepID=UPI0013EA1064|nr:MULTISPECIES: TetR/AcrR family transcriptional regulator [unclassified Enterococcus]
MKLAGYEDLRVQKTIKGIYQAFESLIVEKDYQHITVTELARRAEINKKTFYRYYPTLDDLLAELQARYSEDYLKLIGDFEYPRDLEKSLRAFFEYSDKMGPAYDKISTNQVYSGIRQQMIDKVMLSTWHNSPEFKKLTDFEREVLLKYIENTGMQIYQQWVANDKTEPIEHVIEMTCKLVRSGTDAILYGDK